MGAAAILNLFESKIAPLDPPSPKTPPYNQTWSGWDDRLRRYRHLKFFQHGGGCHLGFVRIVNSAVGNNCVSRDITLTRKFVYKCVADWALCGIVQLFSSRCAVVQSGLHHRAVHPLKHIRRHIEWSLDGTTGCGDIATWNFSNMAVAAILDLFES